VRLRVQAQWSPVGHFCRRVPAVHRLLVCLSPSFPIDIDLVCCCMCLPLFAHVVCAQATAVAAPGDTWSGMSSSRKRPRCESPDAQCSTPVPSAGEVVLDPGYHVSRSKVLTSLWEGQELADVEVVVEGQRFSAHRVVLAAGSPHFRAMFTRTFSESRQHEVELHEMSADGFQGVLTFLYSGELALNDSNTEAVLLAADRCEVVGLVNLCCSYLLDRIAWPNCLHYWALADQVGCVMLRKRSRLVALKFFEELHNNQQLLALESVRFSRMIKSKKLRSTNEQVVLEAVLAWLTHDPLARRHLAVTLLRLVRLPRLSDHVLHNITCHPTLQDPAIAPDLRALLEELQQYKDLSEEEQRKVQMDGSSMWTRKRWCECGWLYAVGGSDGQHHLDSVERYEAVEDVWHPVAPMRTARRNCGVGVLNGQLYAVGGRNENKHVMDNIERYDSKEDRWERIEHPMRTARYFLAVGVLGSKLYIVGGVDKRNASLASAECYDSESGSWTPVAPMSQRRYGCGAGVLHGKLYVVGGTMEKNGDYLETVERYDPVLDAWENVAPMSTSRYCCGVAVINGN